MNTYIHIPHRLTKWALTERKATDTFRMTKEISNGRDRINRLHAKHLHEPPLAQCAALIQYTENA